MHTFQREILFGPCSVGKHLRTQVLGNEGAASTIALDCRGSVLVTDRGHRHPPIQPLGGSGQALDESHARSCGERNVRYLR